MTKESLIIKTYGATRLRLAIMMPVSIVFNIIQATIQIVVMFFRSLFNPAQLLGLLIDVPIVLITSIWKGIYSAITGIREAMQSDFDFPDLMKLERGELLKHKIYGQCRAIEFRTLNENNVVIERRKPHYMNNGDDD